MNRFLCWLTGGHIYHDATLMVRRNPMNRKTVFQNHCLKCGKEYKFEADIDPIIEREIEYEKNRRILYSAIEKKEMGCGE